MRAAEAAALPVWIIGAALASDETFRSYADEVASNRARAYELAARYARAGAGRQAIASMLIEASRDLRPAVMATRLANMGGCGAFVDAPLAPGDRRTAVQERTLEGFKRGAKLLVRRGAGRCLSCGALLARDRRGSYCEAHSKEAWEHATHRTDLTATLRALAEHLQIRTAGPRARRLRRTRS